MTERLDRSDTLTAAGAKLRKWREESGVSQAAAAKEIGASQGAWAAWELGMKAPGVGFAFAIEEMCRASGKGEPVMASDWACALPRKAAAEQTGPHQIVADADAVKLAAGS